MEQPQLFNRYIIGSPSYWWDNKEITKRLSSKSYLLSDSIKSVYTFIGGKEGKMMINNWKEFDSIFLKKSTEKKKNFIRISCWKTHKCSPGGTFSSGINFFPKKSKKLMQLILT